MTIDVLNLFHVYHWSHIHTTGHTPILVVKPLAGHTLITGQTLIMLVTHRSSGHTPIILVTHQYLFYWTHPFY